MKKLACVLAIYGVLQVPVFADESPNLSPMGADLAQTSVSGLSSGAFMTAQIHSAFSGSFIGAGIMAGGPYLCSKMYKFNANMTNAMNTCMNPLDEYVAPDGKKLFNEAKKLAHEGKIDPVENLSKQRVMVFSGGKDSTVKPMVVEQVVKYYEAAGLKAKDTVKYQEISNAGHAITVDNQDATQCELSQPPYINSCGVSEAKEILQQIYGELKPPVETLSGKIVRFNQKEFIKGNRSSMSDDAFAYVPKTCETESCRVHVAIHGCHQGYNQEGVINDNYYTKTGYNQIADANNIIVLYPQAQPSKDIPFNPKGCWDFWGYSDADNFYTKDAPQMQAIMGMIKRLGEARN
jgi:poly(3-hydroxybutyrate) depolymerase